jgi:hypothetical protein
LEKGGQGGFALPLISDGVVFRVLRNLLLLDGERLSYRTLDVEEIGSVYQTIMGFRLEISSGPSIAITGKRKHKGEVAAPNVINLDELLTTKPAERAKWLRERTDQDVTGESERKVKAAATLDDVLAAMERKIARNATPHVVSRGALILQPTDERRRSGSHYTPRSFTEPIVRTTLRPILQRLGEHPTPAQILDLKICDIAVGSAAFLVEACRQLGDELVEAWHRQRSNPQISQMNADGDAGSAAGRSGDLWPSASSVDFIPPDEDEVLHARRLPYVLPCVTSDRPFETHRDQSLSCWRPSSPCNSLGLSQHWKPCRSYFDHGGQASRKDS